MTKKVALIIHFHEILFGLFGMIESSLHAHYILTDHVKVTIDPFLS